ncbi:hypothetical protein PN4B1_23010 [Paenibacillus naphthalenovorans]|nr:hypothetical protein PN4B1_23010 [Paenibacillus naphthalenovorans]
MSFSNFVVIKMCAAVIINPFIKETIASIPQPAKLTVWLSTTSLPMIAILSNIVKDKAAENRR